MVPWGVVGFMVVLGITFSLIGMVASRKGLASPKVAMKAVNQLRKP